MAPKSLLFAREFTRSILSHFGSSQPEVLTNDCITLSVDTLQSYLEVAFTQGERHEFDRIDRRVKDLRSANERALAAEAQLARQAGL